VEEVDELNTVYDSRHGRSVVVCDLVGVLISSDANCVVCLKVYVSVYVKIKTCILMQSGSPSFKYNVFIGSHLV